MTLRRFLITLAFLAVPSLAHAQGVVTGHELLPSGAPPANGKVCASLLGYKPQIPRTSAGAVVQQTNFCVPVSTVDGSFSMTLFTNSAILPAQTLWRFDFMVNGIQQSSATFNVNATPFNLDTAAPTVTFPGPSGYVMGAHTFEFAQASPALTWTIPHNFGDKNVVFNCYDASNKFLEPDTVVETDQNTLTLTFVVPQAGNCTVMTGGNVALTNAPANAVVTAPNAAQVITGQPLTVQGVFTASCSSPINNILYVGGGCAGIWGSGDIGAQINTAYGVLPVNGGQIFVIPNPTGACYSFSTPIIATVASKYLLLDGLGADSQTGTVSNGTCLNYTPTTATTAITIDVAPSSGAGNTRNYGFRHLRLINNQGNTTGGTGSLATGISCTSTNAGCQNATFEDFAVAGFGTGIKLAPGSSNGVSWGVNFTRGALSYNTVGLNIASGIELTILDDMKILGNATGVSMGTSSDLMMTGGSCDSNSINCIASTGGDITTSGVHFENQGSNNAQFINAGLSLHIYGGFALDDCASSAACGGVTPAYWFNSPVIAVHGQDFFTGGRIPTVVYKYSTSGYAEGIANIANIPRGNIIATVGGNAVFNQLQGLASVEAALFMADSGGGATMTCAQVGSITGWGSTGACSNPQGGLQRFQFTMTAGGTGITANPVVTVTFAIPWPIAPEYVCKMSGGTAAVGFVTGETNINPNTLGPLAYIGTPTAGQTVTFSCMGI